MNEVVRPDLYPAFQDWLAAEKAPEDDFDAMLTDVVENLFPHFAYNQFDIARNPEERLRYDEEDEILWVYHNPRRFDLAENSGDCMDIAVKTYLLICEKYPVLKKHIALFDAHEADYFDVGFHKVLLFAE